jgi:hypothetical protein
MTKLQSLEGALSTVINVGFNQDIGTVAVSSLASCVVTIKLHFHYLYHYHHHQAATACPAQAIC